MAIRLDDVDPAATAPSARELIPLHDAVSAAERAVVYWEDQLAFRVRNAQALDGFVSVLLDTLMGRRESRIDARVAQVAEARTRLQSARGTLLDAQMALANGQHTHHERQQAHAARTTAFAAAASHIRTSGHPLARELDGVEVELENLRAESESLMQALTAGAALSAFVGTVKTQFNRAASRVHLADAASLALGMLPTDHVRSMDQALQELPDRIQQFEEACCGVGGAMVVKLPDVGRSSSWDSRLDQLLIDTEGSLRAMRERLENVRRGVGRLEQRRRRIVEAAARRTPGR